MISDIIKPQSLEVDIVSGATVTTSLPQGRGKCPCRGQVASEQELNENPFVP